MPNATKLAQHDRPQFRSYHDGWTARRCLAEADRQRAFAAHLDRCSCEGCAEDAEWHACEADALERRAEELQRHLLPSSRTQGKGEG